MARHCPRCGEIKDDAEFYGPTASYCRTCWSKYKAEARNRPEHRAKLSAAANAWLKRHPSQNRKNVEAYRTRQREKRLEAQQRRIPPNTVSAKEAAARLGISRQRLHQLLLQGRLHAVRQGRQWFVDQADLDRWGEDGESSAEDGKPENERVG